MDTAKNNSPLLILLYVVIGAGAGFGLAQTQDQRWSILILLIVGALFVITYLMGEDRYARVHRAAQEQPTSNRKPTGSDHSPDVKILPKSEARDWLDDFLVKQQKKK